MELSEEKPKRTLENLTRLERKWLRRRYCGFCEVNALSKCCGRYSGLYVLPVIEGVRDEEEVVDLGPPCDMDERRGHALLSYKPRSSGALSAQPSPPA